MHETLVSRVASQGKRAADLSEYAAGKWWKTPRVLSLLLSLPAAFPHKYPITKHLEARGVELPPWFLQHTSMNIRDRPGQA